MTDVRLVKNSIEGGTLVAEYLAGEIASNREFVLGIATGSSPLPVYRCLADLTCASDLDWSAVWCFALDEYVGIPPEHPQSYHCFVRREISEPLHIPFDRVKVPDGSLEGLPTAGERFEQALTQAGGVDVQILGIGKNGHIGFNEPGSSLASLTRVKTLAQQTRLDNARFFGTLERVPTHCVTQGLGTIMRARHLVLLAFGAAKAGAVAATLEGAVTAAVPASVLQLHPHATVVLDEGAASELKNREYYEDAQSQIPAWQGL